MSDLPRLQANNNYGLSFLPSANAIHCMRGELTSYLRLATADEMLTFKEKMVLPSEVMSEFPDHTLTEAELRNDAVALRQFYNKARRIFQEHPLAQRNLSTLKNNIELLEQRLNQIKAPVLHSIFRPEGVLPTLPDLRFHFFELIHTFCMQYHQSDILFSSVTH